MGVVDVFSKTWLENLRWMIKTEGARRIKKGPLDQDESSFKPIWYCPTHGRDMMVEL